jgi:hypothetical protein
MAWPQEEWAKEGVEEVAWEKLLPPNGFEVLPRRWVVQRTFWNARFLGSTTEQEKDEPRDYREALCKRRSVCIYAAGQSPHDAATDSHMRPFHYSFRRVVLGNSLSGVKICSRDKLKAPLFRVFRLSMG